MVRDRRPGSLRALTQLENTEKTPWLSPVACAIDNVLGKYEIWPRIQVQSMTNSVAIGADQPDIVSQFFARSPAKSMVFPDCKPETRTHTW